MCPIDSQYLRHFPEYDPPSLSCKVFDSQKIARQTAEFLASGGSIDHCQYGAFSQKLQDQIAAKIQKDISRLKKDRTKDAQRRSRLTRQRNAAIRVLKRLDRMTPLDPGDVLTINQFRTLCDTSWRTIKGYMDSGCLPCIQISAYCRRVSAASIPEFIANLSEQYNITGENHGKQSR